MCVVHSYVKCPEGIPEILDEFEFENGDSKPNLSEGSGQMLLQVLEILN
jgi:hypothetical protein